KEVEALTEIGSVPKKGDSSEDVKILKVALNKKGAKLDPDNPNFLDATLDAVVAFQKSIGLPGTGNIPQDDGGQTFKGLGLKLVKKAQPKPEAPCTDVVNWKPLIIDDVNVHPIFKVPAPYTHLHPLDF